LEKEEEKPDKDYYDLDELDFRVLQHHQSMGVDYSWMVAGALNIDPDLIFERHKKLKDLKLLKRVEPVMIQYRKNIVDNKWIKHRNHTYYQITTRGEIYLNHFLTHNR
jgi:predicted transcriptional regulator